MKCTIQVNGNDNILEIDMEIQRQLNRIGAANTVFFEIVTKLGLAYSEILSVCTFGLSP